MFAGELSKQPTIKAFIVATFFIAVYLHSLGCCSFTGSRYTLLLSVAKDEVQQSFFINTFLISQMQPTIKNASKANNSTLTRRLTPVMGKKQSAGKPAGITVSITGKRDNRIVHAYWKAICEFFVEETRGKICSEFRLKSKIEAARLLFPEGRKAMRGLTVKIK